jgi:anti-anti-sigma factor
VVIHVTAEELRKGEADGLCAAIDQARAAAPALPFILDMARVNYAASLALGVLVGLTKEFHNRGQRLILAAVQPNMRQAFAITRLNQILEIMPDVASARQSLAGGGDGVVG